MKKIAIFVATTLFVGALAFTNAPASPSKCNDKKETAYQSSKTDSTSTKKDTTRRY